MTLDQADVANQLAEQATGIEAVLAVLRTPGLDPEDVRRASMLVGTAAGDIARRLTEMAAEPLT